jgi:hypothetical protein
MHVCVAIYHAHSREGLLSASINPSPRSTISSLALRISIASIGIAIHRVAVARFPPLLIRLPQCGHSHAARNKNDLSQDALRIDIGVSQFGNDLIS